MREALEPELGARHDHRLRLQRDAGQPIGVGEEMQRAEGLGYDRSGSGTRPRSFARHGRRSRRSRATPSASARYLGHEPARAPSAVTAAAAATVDDLAPGRVYIGIGAGGTGVWHLGMETREGSPSSRRTSSPSAASSRPGAQRGHGHALTLPWAAAPHPDHHGRPCLALAASRGQDRRRRRHRPRHLPRRGRLLARAARGRSARRRPLRRRPRRLVHVVLVGGRRAGQGEGRRRVVGDGLRAPLRRLGRRARVHPRRPQGAAARDRQGLRPAQPRPPERGTEGGLRRARRPARRRPVSPRAVHVRRHSRRGRGTGAGGPAGRRRNFDGAIDADQPEHERRITTWAKLVLPRFAAERAA